ncbi:MAG: hypothetical protein RDV48_26805 [Candidatus Eremiobacteraeota bacterium]|nr:hypothetical protein [Candidatus Eremiobacteraeota bacterium]
MEKKPAKEVSFTEGLEIAPSGRLLEWLKREGAGSPGDRRQVRIPVVIRFQGSPPLFIKDAFIGLSVNECEKSPLFLQLDDSALGIALLQRLAGECPEGQQWCAVWLEGYWGALCEGIHRHEESVGTGAGPVKWPFAVRRIHGKVVDADREKNARIFIESRTP